MLISLDLRPDGPLYKNITVEELLEHGVSQADVNSACKASATAIIETIAENCRKKLASTSAGKLAAYRFKEEIARDPDNADPAETALISREATARGMSTEDLLTSIITQANAYRRAALIVECLEAEAKQVIAAIQDDAADIEAQIEFALDAAQAQAEIAFSEAFVLITGT